ncbi:MAG TPA: 16S rRNA (cytosine(1402)-N(4))-methyltransferase RsmH [Kiritimatiellia bacterium]|nr:16S rRNA (cytosine(1402)-N(4))-methyltransferase RsmH [Kiritimatiellia bacterium]HRZ13768.1 16S rRNA (cytosine(1402)-N(4))-methyltransferase RsmH [Kiritimatiellia bacterium]HSA19707.1 16S rRNA (cytosine(1402)-N(4))-methyltransferase RsmH [Kiritimatiellia bacterium]
MHVPVLLRETLEALGVRAGGTYIDGTVGNGGHAAEMLSRAGPGGRLLGIDQDAETLPRAAERLSRAGGWYRLEQGDYADMRALALRNGIEQADGVLLDLGMSSEQVDDPARGFSFQQDGPLDMRMDRMQERTAATIVNEWTEKELADLLWALGEEPMARRIARRIVEARDREPIRHTGKLAEIVARAKGGRRGRIHPATQTFQALRMAVNHELESLDRALAAAPGLLALGGRLAVISFHRLEDRRVKAAMALHVGRWESLAAGGRRWVGERPVLRWITRKPVTCSPEERGANPRARSAKLRVAERIE